MNYKTKLKTGEEVLLSNDENQTKIQVQIGDSDGKETQGSSVQTGHWSESPTLYENDGEAFVKIMGQDGTLFFKIHNGGVQRLDESPPLDEAKALQLTQTDDEPDKVDMKPMKPMEPLKPLF